MRSNKIIFGAVLVIFFCFIYLNATDDFTIFLKPKWRILSTDEHRVINFGGKWVLVGSITFKKKSKELLIVDKLALHWSGEQFENLQASLYKKTSSSQGFLPIEKNLMCDGCWNRSKQSIIFNFDEKETLNPTTTFYVVLTIPSDREDVVRNGTFVLEEQFLPKPFKQSLSPINLSFSLYESVSKDLLIPTV